MWMKAGLPIALVSALALGVVLWPEDQGNAMEAQSRDTASLNDAEFQRLNDQYYVKAEQPAASVKENESAAAEPANNTPVSEASENPENADLDADAADAPAQAGDKAAFKWTPQAGDTIDFEVLRKGKPFGYHRVSFDGDASGELTVTSDVKLEAGLGPIKVFQYKLDATETWSGGQLKKLSGETNDDGEDEYIEASLSGEQINIEGSDYSGTAPASIIPSSHWNIAQMDASQILSTENGEILEVTVEQIGSDAVIVGGQSVDATHYRMSSDITVDLWYDTEGRWVKMQFEARDQQIEYRLNKLY